MSAEHPAGLLLAEIAKQAIATPEGQRVLQVARKAGAAVRALREEAQRIDAQAQENAAKVREFKGAIRDLFSGGRRG